MAESYPELDIIIDEQTNVVEELSNLNIEEKKEPAMQPQEYIDPDPEGLYGDDKVKAQA